MEGGVKAVLNCDLFKKYYPGAIIEKKIMRENVFGIHGMHGTLDLNNKRKKIIIDLKTTSCETYEQFEKKAIQLAYPRQGEIYLQIDGEAEHFYILGVSKKNIGTIRKPIYPTFLFDLDNYEKERQQAREEAQFLLTFYKQYGLPIDKYTDPAKFVGFQVEESTKGSRQNSKSPQGRKR